MDRLNYHHLLYFWVVAKEGGIGRAAKVLRLASPTVSGQIHLLEEGLGEKLFDHRGRHLVLTDFGRVAFGYAEEIFGLGRQFMDALHGRAPARPVRLVVGLADALPKAIVHQMLRPAFALENAQILCREARSAQAFLGDLAVQAVDVVLSDAPAVAGGGVEVFDYLLGECGTLFFAATRAAPALRRRFPDSLHGARLLLPGHNSALRPALATWLADRHLRPEIVAEVDDPALMEVFGEAGLGIFAIPDVVEADVRARFEVGLVGRAPELRQRFYAISVERKLKHPAVVAICDASREALFASRSRQA